MPDPVWHNRDVPLYMVDLVRPNKTIRSVLVLTSKGLVHAHEVGSHYTKLPAVRAVIVIYPLLSPTIQEVEHLFTDKANRVIAQRTQLMLYRVVCKWDAVTNRECLVWTKRNWRQAGAFAMKSLACKEVKDIAAITAPLIVADIDAGEKILAHG